MKPIHLAIANAVKEAAEEDERFRVDPLSLVQAVWLVSVLPEDIVARLTPVVEGELVGGLAFELTLGDEAWGVIGADACAERPNQVGLSLIHHGSQMELAEMRDLTSDFPADWADLIRRFYVDCEASL